MLKVEQSKENKISRKKE